MRVLFVGCVEFSKSMLSTLIDLDVELVGVVTKKESSYNSDFGNLGPLSEESGIKTFYTKNINDFTIIAELQELKPDYIFCLGWNQLLSEDVLKIPKYDTIGYHPAKIPSNRGRHPIIWALALGLNSTASTFFSLEKEADSGDILSQIDVEIDYEDDANSLYQKLTNVAKKQLIDMVTDIEKNRLKRVSQVGKPSNAWRKRSAIDGKIDFRMSKKTIYNLVRALTKPYVGAHVTYLGEEVKVWSCIESTNDYPENIEPGKILEVSSDGILVKVPDGAVKLIHCEFSKLPNVGEYFYE